MMNQRLKELREQAADFAGVVWAKQTMATFDTNKSIETLFEGKFAELIVRECIDTVLDCSVEYTTRPQIAQEIKQHFGMEQ